MDGIFFAEVCRKRQFLFCLNPSGGSPELILAASFPPCLSQEQLFAHPKAALCQRSFLLTKRSVDHFLWALQLSKGGEGWLVPTLGHSPSQHSWPHSSSATKVKDINSHRELSNAELKHKALPPSLWWLISWDLTDSNTWTKNIRIMTAFLEGSHAFDSAGFPQPQTCSSSTHYLQIGLYAGITQGKSTTWLRNCNENSQKTVMYVLCVKCASPTFFILLLLSILFSNGW